MNTAFLFVQKTLERDGNTAALLPRTRREYGVSFSNEIYNQLQKTWRVTVHFEFMGLIYFIRF
jgi:hypothetical protein